MTGLAAAAKFWEAHVPEVGDLASIVYTSRTTGRPKGAMLSHGNFTFNVDQTFSRVMFYETDHFLLVLPLFHVFAFTLDFLMPLRKRAQISLARSMRSVPADLAELHPTVFMAVPLLVELLYARARALITSLRVLGVGGAPISKGTLDDLIRAGVFVLEGYGITECAPGVSYPDEKRYVPGTVGMPLDGMEWRITNSDETGAGELRVKGPNVMRGYWKNPVLAWSVFGVEWGMVLLGVMFKIRTAGQFRYFSTAAYIVMGWVAVAALVPLMRALQGGGTMWLVLGGVLYTLGCVFYLLKSLPYSHMVWHLFVLAGTICHFFCILWHVM